MIKVPKKVEYSLVFIKFLADNKVENVSLKEVSMRAGLPYRFLAKIAAVLKNGGILESREGKSGGYWLASGWEERSLFDLVAVLGEDKRLVECLSGRCELVRGRCAMRSIWVEVEKGLREGMKGIKLGEIKN